MVRYLNQEEKLSCKGFWREIFDEDSETFIDFYFQEKIKDNQILVLEDQGRIDAMLHLNPYQVAVRQFVWKVDYIVGVATRMDRRHRGYMRTLLEVMMKDMEKARVPFTFLMPAHPDIYTPFQFAYVFDQPKWTLKEPELIKRVRCDRESDFAAIASWMNAWMLEHYEVYAVRDEAYVRGLLKELEGELGYLELLYQGKQLVGVEGIWGAQSPQQRCLLANTNLVEEVAQTPAIMARIICLEEMLAVICLKENMDSEEYCIKIKIIDPLIQNNEGIWEWHLTKETSWIVPVNEGQLDVMTLSIQELEQWLFGYKLPTQAAHLEDVVQVLQGVFLDEVV